MQHSQCEALRKSIEWFPRKILLWYNTEGSFCRKNGKKKGGKMCELKRKRNWNSHITGTQNGSFVVDHNNTEFLMQKGFKNRKEGIQCARKAQGDVFYYPIYFFFPSLSSEQRERSGMRCRDYFGNTGTIVIICDWQNREIIHVEISQK